MHWICMWNDKSFENVNFILGMQYFAYPNLKYSVQYACSLDTLFVLYVILEVKVMFGPIKILQIPR